MTTATLAPRTALFLPASNPRAIAKATGLAVDMVILDLEDAVRAGDKDAARQAAVAAAEQGLGASISAIRLNAIDTEEYALDMAPVGMSACDFVVLPKVERPEDAATVAEVLGKPLLAMIETPRGVLAAAEIAAAPGVRGLIAGTNDLRVELGIPEYPGREGMSLALQMIVLAARASRIWALDGVFNALADPEGLARECQEGRRLGFDGKTLIHPGQIEIAQRAFGPSEAEIVEARALIAAATGGAERYRDRMIEAMHVEQAKALLARS